MKEVYNIKNVVHEEVEKGTAVSLFSQSQELERSPSEATEPGAALAIGTISPRSGSRCCGC